MHAAHSPFHVVHLLGFLFSCPSIGTASTEQAYVTPAKLCLRLSLLNSKRWDSTA
jgi:hypothetical protein